MTKTILAYLFTFIAFMVLFFKLGVIVGESYEKSMPKDKDGIVTSTKTISKSSMIRLFIDPKTGCEYLTSYKGGVYPRMVGLNTHKGCK